MRGKLQKVSAFEAKTKLSELLRETETRRTPQQNHRLNRKNLNVLVIFVPMTGEEIKQKE